MYIQFCCTNIYAWDQMVLPCANAFSSWVFIMKRNVRMYKIQAVYVHKDMHLWSLKCMHTKRKIFLLWKWCSMEHVYRNTELC